MEITREKPADIRVSDQSSPKQARPVPDVVSTLEQGTRFQATVLESKGMFALIDTGEGQALRARSTSPLPQGANVELEVTDTGNPVQVRLVSITSQEQDQQALQAQALNREMLNMRARLSALHSVFSKYSMTDKGTQADGSTDTSGSKTDDLTGALLKGIQQGAEADPAKARSMSALLQPSSSSGKSMLEEIVAAFRAINRAAETGPTDKRPVPPSTGLKDSTVQDSGTAQPRLATSQHGPAGPAYRPGAGEQAAGWKPSDKPGMAPGLQPDPPPSSSKDAGFTPLVRIQRPSTAEKSKAAETASKEAASPQGTVRPQTANTPEGTGDTRYTRPHSGASHRVQQPSVTKPAAQDRAAGNHKLHMQPPAKDTIEPERPSHSEHLARNNQPSSEHGQAHAATGKGMDSPHQPRPSSKIAGASPGKATVTTGGKAGFQTDENPSSKTGAHALKGDMTPHSPAGSTASQVRTKDVIPSVEPVSVQNIMDRTTEHTENPQGNTAPPPDTSQRSFASDSSAHRMDSPAPGPKHKDLAWHAQRGSITAGEPDPAHEDQTIQPQNSAQQADRPASHESGILRFFNALASHGQSLHQYQQQVQDFLNSPFFMVPLWFENGQGHGHWSWWREEAGNDTDDRGEVEHLAFDLELTGIGRINMHLLRQGHGLSLHAAASRQVLPLLRAGMKELKERMESIGFSFTVADIFPIEETDSTELLSPIPPADRMSKSSVSIIA